MYNYEKTKNFVIRKRLKNVQYLPYVSEYNFKEDLIEEEVLSLASCIFKQRTPRTSLHQKIITSLQHFRQQKTPFAGAQYWLPKALIFVWSI